MESAGEKKGSRRSSASSAQSVESDFSIWTDTGDLAEQLADEEDPLRARLSESLDQEIFRGGSGKARDHQTKRVHYPQELPRNRASVIEKESIEIPQPPPRRIPRAERVLAVIMSPMNRQAASTHGLVGKPLL